MEARQRRGELLEMEVLTDFQLQVEHALDLEGRELVVFADAAAAGPAPFALTRLAPQRDLSHSTHAMSPGGVMRVFRQMTGRGPPPAWLLAIRGYAFGLGRPVSPAGRRNLDAAEARLLEFLREAGRRAG
jgi:hydrogenase maturation protease